MEGMRRAWRILMNDLSEKRPPRPAKRDCSIWASLIPGDSYRCLVWGTEDHMRADARANPEEPSS